MLLMVLLACIDTANSTYGVGSTYTQTCSSKMEITGADEYRATCVPAECGEAFFDMGVSHVVVAVDPGKKVVGYAQRSCIQDLTKVGLMTPAADVQIDPAPEAE